MKRIVEIVPARPGWYVRWRPTADTTWACPVVVWVLVEEADGTNREVIGIDEEGRWPGAGDDENDLAFVRYLFQPLGSGHPDDASEPAGDPVERITTR